MDQDEDRLLNIDRPVRRKSGRYRYLFLVATVCGGSFFLLFINNITEVLFLGEPLTPVWYQEHDTKQEESYTIKTEGCTIPGMQPFSEDIMKFVFYPVPKRCLPYNQSLLQYNRTHIWTSKNNFKYYNITSRKNVSCCYRPFYRPDSVVNVYSRYMDERVQFRICSNFSNAIKVKHEFVFVKCTYKLKTVFSQYFLFTPKKKLKLHDGSKEAEKNDTYNVVMLGIDAVSRLNFHRTMPKTVTYLKKKGAVELLGYNKIDDNSFPNLVPILMGYKHTEIKTICHPHTDTTFDFCPFIWNLFKDAGYYTALGEDSSSLGTFNYQLDGFFRTPTDYYLRTFIHQVQYFIENENQRSYPSYSCMKDRYYYKILLDYTEDLMNTLHSSRLFGFFWEITMSHDRLNSPMVMDDDYEQFLKRLEDSKYLDETILILLSDHGIRYGDIRYTKQGSLEERLPFVFVLTPPSFREKYNEAYNNLKLNSHRFTSPFDLHAMLSDLANLNNIKNERILSRSLESYALRREISLFLQIPTNRTCEMADIHDHWCTCHTDKKVSTTNENVVVGAKFLVKHLNTLVRDQKQCAKLSLDEIIDATELVWTKTPGKKQKEYMIVVRTKPGGGLFEATLRLKSSWTMVGSASRLNLYGNQSSCIHYPRLKLYCYCK